MLDKIVEDLENEEEEEDKLHQPNVTHFDKPTSVTFGGSGGDSATRIPNSDGCFSEQQSTKTISDSNPVPSTTVSSKRPKDTNIMEEKLTRNGGKVVDAHSGKMQHMWSQTRDEVIVSILVPAGTSATDLHVKYIAEENTKVELKGIGRPSLSVVLAGKSLLKGRLAYKIWFEDEEDEYEVDWDLEDFDTSHRCIKVTKEIASFI